MLVQIALKRLASLAQHNESWWCSFFAPSTLPFVALVQHTMLNTRSRKILPHFRHAGQLDARLLKSVSALSHPMRKSSTLPPHYSMRTAIWCADNGGCVCEGLPLIHQHPTTCKKNSCLGGLPKFCIFSNETFNGDRNAAPKSATFLTIER